jgi:hypothetical protein
LLSELVETVDLASIAFATTKEFVGLSTTYTTSLAAKDKFAVSVIFTPTVAVS